MGTLGALWGGIGLILDDALMPRQGSLIVMEPNVQPAIQIPPKTRLEQAPDST